MSEKLEKCIMPRGQGGRQEGGPSRPGVREPLSHRSIDFYHYYRKHLSESDSQIL